MRHDFFAREIENIQSQDLRDFVEYYFDEEQNTVVLELK